MIDDNIVKRPGLRIDDSDGAVAELPFVRSTDDADLIFYIDRFSGLKRLYIPQPVIKDVLNLAHGEGYPGFERCFEIISKSWYIYRMAYYLR